MLCEDVCLTFIMDTMEWVGQFALHSLHLSRFKGANVAYLEHERRGNAFLCFLQSGAEGLSGWNTRTCVNVCVCTV